MDGLPILNIRTTTVYLSICSYLLTEKVQWELLDYKLPMDIDFTIPHRTSLSPLCSEFPHIRAPFCPLFANCTRLLFMNARIYQQRNQGHISNGYWRWSTRLLEALPSEINPHSDS